MSSSRLCPFIKSTRAAAVVEMAIVTPFLVALGLGVLEFGKVLYDYQVITVGLRDGARYLARVNNPGADQLKGKELAVFGEIGGSAKRLNWWGTSDVQYVAETIANPTVSGLPSYRGQDPIVVIRLSTNVAHPGLGFFSILGLSGWIRIKAYHRERWIGE